MLDVASVVPLARWVKWKKHDIMNTHSEKDTWIDGMAAKFVCTRCLSHRTNSVRLNFINELVAHVIITKDTVSESMIRNKGNKLRRICLKLTLRITRNFFRMLMICVRSVHG